MKIKFIQKMIDVIRGKGKQKELFYEKGEITKIKVPQKSSADIKIEHEEKKLQKFVKKHTPPKNTYKKIICACGFGDSGSGAITDLLSEFDNVTVIGDHDVYGGSPLSKDKTIPRFEVDIFRCYSGIFDLESAFEPVTTSSNIKILAFLQAMQYYYKTPRYHICNDKFIELVYEFIDNITVVKIDSVNPLDGNNAFIFEKGVNEEEYSNIYNPFVFGALRKRYYWIPKNITKKQYRAYAKEFIIKFLNTIESKEILSLDQFFSGCGSDFECFREYIGDYKMISVYRDPRDVYTQAILVKHLWVPNNPDEFIEWYKARYIENYISAEDPCHICIRFEDLIFDYDNTTDKIINFLEIDKSHHINPKGQFNPEFSKRNVGIHKLYEDQNTIKYIEKNLRDFCYFGEK